jgi:hypothetical protein
VTGLQESKASKEIQALEETQVQKALQGLQARKEKRESPEKGGTLPVAATRTKTVMLKFTLTTFCPQSG